MGDSMSCAPEVETQLSQNLLKKITTHAATYA